MMGLGHLLGKKWPWGALEGSKVPQNDENWVFVAISHPGRPKLLDQSGSLLDLDGLHPG